MLWRVWVHGDEIYLAPRGMAQLVNLSLHSSGIWRWAWVKDSVLDEELEGDRAHERWLKPGPFIPGWIVGPSVMFLVGGRSDRNHEESLLARPSREERKGDGEPHAGRTWRHGST